MYCESFNYSTRLNSLKTRADLFDWKFGLYDTRDLLIRADQIKKLSSIILNYPEHFKEIKTPEIKKVIENTHLNICGINLRYPQDIFRDGAFTNPDKRLREEAIDLTLQAIDICREMNASHLILWL